MIRYELKDKERQAALEKALPGFREALRCPETEGQMLEFTHWGSSADWEDDDWSLTIHRNQLNEVVEYDPTGWNDYPEVTPPEGVLMRLEVVEASWDHGLEGERLCAIWKVKTFKIKEDDKKTETEVTEGRWYREWKGKLDEMLETYGFAPEEKIFKARFRPWDEEAAK